MNSTAQLDLAPPEQKTILVVGSDNKLASDVGNTLHGWGIERAPDNRSALALVEAHPFDLVVTSEKTSGEADVELLRKIRRARPHVRLIILTSERTPTDVIAAIRERAFSYFSLPCSSAAFREMIKLAAEEPCWDDGIEIISATPEWIRMLARCDRKTANRLSQFFYELIDLPESEKERVAAAFREMLLNAIEHGGQFDSTQYVEISYLRARHAVICRIKDPGGGFSLDEIKHAAVANPPEDPIRHQVYRDAKRLRPGGFGILIARSLVDELIYGERGNDVLLIKYLNA